MEKERTLKIKTRMGERIITMDRVIRFPKGLVGFEKMRDFALLQLKSDSPFFLLQSLEDPELGLIMADPYTFVPDLKVAIGSAEQKILKAKNIRELAVLVTVSIPQGRPEETTLNLIGPVVVNAQLRIGLQIPQTEPGLPAHFVIGKGIL